MTGCHDTNIHAAMTVLHRETKRANIREHKSAARIGELEKPTIEEQVWSNDHQNDIKVSDKVANNTTLLIKVWPGPLQAFTQSLMLSHTHSMASVMLSSTHQS